MTYTITEPHPSVASGHYIHSGRGGAGNAFRAPSNTIASPARPLSAAALFSHGLPNTSTSSTSSKTKNKYSAGRGGAGNIHPAVEQPRYDVEDEMKRQVTRESLLNGHELYHVGRGGAGNWTRQSGSISEESGRKTSTSSEDSAGSNGSRRSGFFNRLSANFERR